ncbi:ATP-binding protein [Streptomyces reniochalinae]|uniref:ATP-binding protein n=1 Tax=Streptomyces reniochalinae TaxID=2250578 RepID=A0A367ENV9_9ACTN|nr:ATP-binding protein [Streptomyces reniochalinae]RCG19402.1 ATP-binding protein [Streptomyces reniochalinae]
MHSPAHQRTATVRTFRQLLSSTRRGARLARLLAAGELRTWQIPPSVAERAEHVVAELAANAVSHGSLRGRDFRLGLLLDPATAHLRIEVTDARGEYRPRCRPDLAADSESGRGLLLVTALADCWGTEPYPPSGKTVWATLTVPGACASDSAPHAAEHPGRQDTAQ